MKKSVKRLAAFALLLVAVTLLPLAAFAATKEYTVTVEEGASNCLITLYWENADVIPLVVVTDPAGAVYSSDAMPEVLGTGEMIFYFDAPIPGAWKVAITAEGIGRFDLTAGELPGRMDITSFTVQVDADGNATAAWAVADSEEDLRFEVWASTDPENLSGVRVAGFDGPAAGGSHSFSVAELDTGDYWFYLKAIGSGGIFSTARAGGDALHWVDASALSAPDAAARMLDHELWMSWAPVEDARSYRVVVSDADTGEVIHDEMLSDDNNWYGAIPESTARVRAWVAACDHWGVNGDYTVFTVDRVIADGAAVTFPQADRLNTRTVVIPVTFAEGCSLSVALDGGMILEDQTQPGDYRVDLAEGDNLLTFYVMDAAGSIRSFAKQLHVDTVPPVLSIRQDLDGLSTGDSSVWLSGRTENGAQLALNGQPVDLQRGYFNQECPLRRGKNTLELVATDGVGNQTVYTAVITRPWLDGMLLGWIGCGVLFLGLAALYIVRFVRAGKAGRNEKA